MTKLTFEGLMTSDYFNLKRLKNTKTPLKMHFLLVKL